MQVTITSEMTLLELMNMTFLPSPSRCGVKASLKWMTSSTTEAGLAV